jgi:hypothetical protein
VSAELDAERRGEVRGRRDRGGARGDGRGRREGGDEMRKINKGVAKVNIVGVADTRGRERISITKENISEPFREE